MTPEKFRGMVSTVLIVGVGISAALIGAGFVAALAVGWQGSLIGAAHAVGSSTADFGGLPGRLSALEPAAIAQLGLVTLLATRLRETDAVIASQCMLRSSLASSSLTPNCRLRSRAVRLATFPRVFTWRSTSS